MVTNVELITGNKELIVMRLSCVLSSFFFLQSVWEFKVVDEKVGNFSSDHTVMSKPDNKKH